MFLVEQRHTPAEVIDAKDRFARKQAVHSLGTTYKEETRAHFSLIEFFQSLFPGERVEPFSLGRVFKDLLVMREKGEEREQVVWKKTLEAALNLWSLRQEVTGERETIEVVTPIHIQEGKIYFQSDLRSIEDFEVMFEKSLNEKNKFGWSITPESSKPRYKRENRQLIGRWEKASSILKSVDMSAHPRFVERQLEALGFTKKEIEITPSLAANVLSVRQGLQSIEDFARLVETEQKMTVWVGPAHHLTISSPHRLHSKGNSSFIWDTTVYVNPETKETWISEHGFFSYTPLRPLLSVLAWKQEHDHVFSSEDEVMKYINTVLGFANTHPNELLRQLVSEIDGVVAASKMDKNVVEGPFNIRPFVNQIQELFRFEAERCEQNPKFIVGSYERLQYMAEKVRHLAALNDSTGLDEVVRKYKELFGDVGAATNPEKGKRLFDSLSLAINPKLGVKLDWSLFDCIAGTPESLLNQASSLQIDAKLALGKEIIGGATRAELQAGIDHRKSNDFANDEEAKAFAKMYNIDPNWIGTAIKRHDPPIQCLNRGCGELRHYVGGDSECGMCLQCNAQYNLDHGLVKGVDGKATNDIGKATNSEEKEEYEGTTNVSDFVSKIFTGDKVWEHMKKRTPKPEAVVFSRRSPLQLAA
jgi:hypothetical protein